MQLDVQSRPFKLTSALKASVSRSLSGIDERFGERVNKVIVRMDDINGKRGGVDKRCRIVSDLKAQQTVVAEALSNDLYQSISIAARRAKAALRRNVNRARTLKVAPPQVSLVNPEAIRE
ncbi:MAG: putative sigma-54 modulation protein [Gammaproteobacteria bacterium]|jgi:putative sigma-54 modulation protein